MRWIFVRIYSANWWCTRPTCRTRRNLRRIDHGCIFTDCSTSLCSRMFSNICSLVESWLLLAPSPIEMPVLCTHRKYCNWFTGALFNASVFVCFFGWSHLLARTGRIHAGPPSIGFHNIRRIARHTAYVSHLARCARSPWTMIASSSTARASMQHPRQWKRIVVVLRVQVFCVLGVAEKIRWNLQPWIICMSKVSVPICIFSIYPNYRLILDNFDPNTIEIQSNQPISFCLVVFHRTMHRMWDMA